MNAYKDEEPLTAGKRSVSPSLRENLLEACNLVFFPIIPPQIKSPRHCKPNHEITTGLNHNTTVP